MLRKHLFTLISLILFSISYACVFEVELPKDITSDMVFNGDQDVVIKLHEYFKETYNDILSQGIDAIVIWTKDGVLIKDNKESQKFTDSNDITFLRGTGWSDNEWSGDRGILWHLYHIRNDGQGWYGVYAVAKKLAGPPLFNINVTIYKDASLSGGVYYPNSNTMYIPGISTDQYKGILTHEMMHAFQDNCLIEWSHFTEGFAKSCEVIIQSNFSGDEEEPLYPGIDHYDICCIKYDEVGLEQLSCKKQQFYYLGEIWKYLSGLAELRYDTCGFCWYKLWIEDGMYDNLWNFYKDFNSNLRTYYDNHNNNPPGYDDSKKILYDSYTPSTIEGKSFGDWFNSQWILRNDATDLVSLVVLPFFDGGYYSQVGVISYYRPYNEEEPLSDYNVTLFIIDIFQNVVFSGSGYTDYNGRVDFDNINAPIGQRLYLIAYGLYSSTILYTPSKRGTSEKELVGIVYPGVSGHIHLSFTPASGGLGLQTDISVLDGYFDYDNIQQDNGKGKYTLSYYDSNNNLIYERSLDKDKAPMYPVVGNQPTESCPLELKKLISDIVNGIPVQFNNTIEKPEKISLKIYPNPVYDNANIEIANFDNINNNFNAKIELYDMSGRLINTIAENFVVSNNIISFDTSNISPGVYFIRFVCGESSIIQPLIRCK